MQPAQSQSLAPSAGVARTHIEAAAPTLSTNQESADELISRLGSIRGRLEALADSMAGPTPLSAEGAGEAKSPDGRMEHLHHQMRTCHDRCSQVENLLARLEEALG